MSSDSSSDYFEALESIVEIEQAEFQHDRDEHKELKPLLHDNVPDNIFFDDEASVKSDVLSDNFQIDSSDDSPQDQNFQNVPNSYEFQQKYFNLNSHRCHVCGSQTNTKKNFLKKFCLVCKKEVRHLPDHCRSSHVIVNCDICSEIVKSKQLPRHIEYRHKKSRKRRRNDWPIRTCNVMKLFLINFRDLN